MSKQEQAYSYSTLIRKCLLQSSRRNKQTRASVQQEQDRPGVGCFSESAGTSQSSATHRRRGAVREISLKTNIVPHWDIKDVWSASRLLIVVFMDRQPMIKECKQSIKHAVNSNSNPTVHVLRRRFDRQYKGHYNIIRLVSIKTVWFSWPKTLTLVLPT